MFDFESIASINFLDKIDFGDVTVFTGSLAADYPSLEMSRF